MRLGQENWYPERCDERIQGRTYRLSSAARALPSTKRPSFTSCSCFALSISNTIFSLSRFIISLSSARSLGVIVERLFESRNAIIGLDGFEVKIYYGEKVGHLGAQRVDDECAWVVQVVFSTSDGPPAQIRNWSRTVRRCILRELIELGRLSSRSSRCTFKNDRWT
jgi:hypothetical protein